MSNDSLSPTNSLRQLSKHFALISKLDTDSETGATLCASSKMMTELAKSISSLYLIEGSIM